MDNFFMYIKERANYFLGGKFLSKNTTAKIISIIFALVLWLYVMGEVNPETTIPFTDIEIKLLNEDTLKQSGLVVLEPKDFSVDVRINGRRNDLYRIKPEDILASADLRGCSKGTVNIPIIVSVPSYVSVEDTSPKHIRVTLDRIVRRKKEIVIKAVGKAAEGFEPGVATTFPSEVFVVGAETLVNKVVKVVAEVPVGKESGQIAQRVALKPVDKDGKIVRGVDLETKYAEIVLPMQRVKEAPISVTLKGKPKENYKLIRTEIKPERVLLKGPKEQIENIKEVKTTEIQLDGLDRNTTKKVQLILPEGVETPYLSRALDVTLIIEKIKTKEFIFTKDEILIKGLATTYGAELKELPDTITVQVSAAESIIDNLDKNDIQLYINAGELSAGSHSVVLLYSISKDIESVNIAPDIVTIEIQ